MILLEDSGGLDTFPRGGNFDQDALLWYADRFIELILLDRSSNGANYIQTSMI